MTQQDYASDDWLSGYIGKPCWRVIEPSGLTTSPVGLSSTGFAYAKVSSDATHPMSHLIKHGFALMETSVALATDRLVVRGLSPDSGIVIRDAVPQDRDGVCAVARAAFSVTRFHMDPAIPRTTADAIKAGWAGNYFDGRRGSRMIVAEAAGRILGFLQLLSPAPDRWVIDLIGVGKASRGQNIGGAMINAIPGHRPGPVQVTVGTQLRNYRSLAFYHALGFQIASTSHVLHAHW